MRAAAYVEGYCSERMVWALLATISNLGHALLILLTKKMGCAPEGVGLGSKDGESSDGVGKGVHYVNDVLATVLD